MFYTAFFTRTRLISSCFSNTYKRQTQTNNQTYFLKHTPSQIILIKSLDLNTLTLLEFDYHSKICGQAWEPETNTKGANKSRKRLFFCVKFGYAFFGRLDRAASRWPFPFVAVFSPLFSLSPLPWEVMVSGLKLEHKRNSQWNHSLLRIRALWTREK